MHLHVPIRNLRSWRSLSHAIFGLLTLAPWAIRTQIRSVRDRRWDVIFDIHNPVSVSGLFGYSLGQSGTAGGNLTPTTARCLFTSPEP